MVLPLLVSTQFQILFHSPSGVLFTFPSRYFVHYRSLRCLALGDGPPGFPQDFTCPVVLEDNREESDFHLQDCHLLWLAFPRHSINQNLCNFSLVLQYQYCCLTTPLILSLQTACINGLGCSLFARRYWGNRYLLFCCWVAPFGHDRVYGCLLLTDHFRGLAASFFDLKCQGIRCALLFA